MILRLLVLAIALYACNQSKLSSENYKIWCEKNLVANKIIDGNTFQARAFTDEYNVARKEITSAEMSRSKYKTVYVNYKISAKGGEESLLGRYNTPEFDETLNYFVEQAKNDFHLIVDSDTIRPSIYHLERTFNITNYIMLDMAFELKPNQELHDCYLIYDDKKLSTGAVVLGFPKLNSNRMPQLM